MNIMYLLLNIFGESAGYIFDRMNYKRTRIGFRPLMFLGFLEMMIFLGLFLVFAGIPIPQFTWVSAGLIALIVGFSFTGNVFDYLSLKVDDISLREPLVDFYPILAGLVGFALFPSERKPIYLAAFIAGSLVIRWGFRRIRLGEVQRKGVGYLILAIIFYSILPSLYEATLDYLRPEYIAFLRITGIFFLVLIFFPFKKTKKTLTPKRIWYSLLSSAPASVAAIAGIYAIQAFGVVLTMLFLMLGPACRYLAAQFVLKEKVRRSEIVASLMLAVIVAITAFAS